MDQKFHPDRNWAFCPILRVPLFCAKKYNILWHLFAFEIPFVLSCCWDFFLLWICRISLFVWSLLNGFPMGDMFSQFVWLMFAVCISYCLCLDCLFDFEWWICLVCLFNKPLLYGFQIVDDEGNILPRGQEGVIGVRCKPHRPVGLFTHYVVNSLYYTPLNVLQSFGNSAYTCMLQWKIGNDSKLSLERKAMAVKGSYSTCIASL